MITRIRINCLLLLFCCVEILTAQDLNEQTRRWALTGSFGGNWPVLTKNTSFGDAAGPGTIHSLMLEYYIPSTRFSLKGGYWGEEINLSGGIDASLSNLEIGGRYYFLPQRFIVQPYGGISTAWNLSPRSDKGITSGGFYDSSKQVYQKEYDSHYSVREPLFTASPLLGADIYILSCLALTLEYNFRMGVDGKFESEIIHYKPNTIGTVRSNGMRNAFSIGLKINFPFTVTEHDGNSIGRFLDEVIFEKYR